MALRMLVMVTCLIASIPGALGTDIELGSDGRYAGIVVSIDRSIGTDWGLLDKLKASFQRGSEFLAQATKPVANGTRSYAFGSVSFLLPADWGTDGNKSSAVATAGEDDGHFRVHESGSQELWTPQPFGCGQPGLFTQLHRAFITAVDEEHLGRSLVHSFAHLRWGVYDEFNGHAGPHVYVRRGRLQPVRCSESLSGRLGHNETGAACRVDRETLQPEPHCRYFVGDHQPLARASLMYVSYLDAVRQFCATVSDPQLAHNADSPNPHNVHCQGAGARDVLARHADFLLGPEVTDPDTRVNFTEVRPPTARRLVLIVDVSRSMRGEPLDKMKQSIQTLLHQLEDGVHCALVAFSTSVRVLKPLGAINGTASRQEYWGLVQNLTAQGVTATGDALAAAMELLGCDLSRPSRQHAGHIVLITDGEENSRVRYSLDDVIEIARQTSISIDTVAFGRLADVRLANLSAATGGSAHFVRFLGPANDLAESLAQLAAATPICLASSHLAGRSGSLRISVDPSASRGGLLQVFVVSGARPAKVRLRLATPAGDVIDAGAAGVDFHLDEQLGSAVLTLGGALPTGQWQLNVSVEVISQSESAELRTEATNQSVMVTARGASSDWRPTFLRGFLSQTQAALDSQTRASVHAYLIRGSEFVRPADLWARVDSDDGLVVSFRLFDHGAGADVTKADGIYSAYLPVHQMASVQDYSVSLQCLSPVSRVATAGKFSVTGVDAGSLSGLPPARVTNLECGVNVTSGTVRLSWTAVGDRLDSGTAAGYIVKASVSREFLISDFDSADNVTAPTVTPLPAGRQQTLTTAPGQIPTYNGTFYLALKAESATSQRSDLSNVVATQLTLPENLDEIEAGGYDTTLGMESSMTSSTESSTSSSQESSASSSQESSTASSQESSASASQESSTASSQESSASSSQESSTASSQESSASSSQESSTASSQESSASSSQESTTASSQESNASSSKESSQESSTSPSQESSTASSQESSASSSQESSQESSASSSQESSTASSQESSASSSQESSTATHGAISTLSSVTFTTKTVTTKSSAKYLTTRLSDDGNSGGMDWLHTALIASALAAVLCATLTGALLALLYTKKMQRSRLMRRSRKVAPKE